MIETLVMKELKLKRILSHRNLQSFSFQTEVWWLVYWLTINLDYSPLGGEGYSKILKEYSYETLNIFWKSPYRKIYEFLKWNNWKIHFFFFFQPSVFLIFVKRWTPVFTFYFWLINLWRYNEHVLRIIRSCY